MSEDNQKVEQGKQIKSKLNKMPSSVDKKSKSQTLSAKNISHAQVLQNNLKYKLKTIENQLNQIQQIDLRFERYSKKKKIKKQSKVKDSQQNEKINQYTAQIQYGPVQILKKSRQKSQQQQRYGLNTKKNKSKVSEPKETKSKQQISVLQTKKLIETKNKNIITQEKSYENQLPKNSNIETIFRSKLKQFYRRNRKNTDFTDSLSREALNKNSDKLLLIEQKLLNIDKKISISPTISQSEQKGEKQSAYKPSKKKSQKIKNIQIQSNQALTKRKYINYLPSLKNLPKTQRRPDPLQRIQFLQRKADLFQNQALAKIQHYFQQQKAGLSYFERGYVENDIDSTMIQALKAKIACAELL